MAQSKRMRYNLANGRSYDQAQKLQVTSVNFHVIP